jgi:hypothetical protein
MAKPQWRSAVLAFVCTALGVAPAGVSGAEKEVPAQQKPNLLTPVKFDVSAPLWMMKPPSPSEGAPRQGQPIRRIDPRKRAGKAALAQDPLLSRAVGQIATAPMPEPSLVFEGTSDADNAAVAGGRIVPPDTNGAVGPNHYVQWNNLVFKVFHKDGTTALGPLPGTTLFSGFGAPCEANNDGDPLVLYDQLADRWLLTQFAITQGTQCVAISQTPDPTGAYFRYAFIVTPGAENDYPKFGIWPTATNSAYVATFRHFPNFGIVAGAFERDKMLAGDPLARFVMFTLNAPAGPDCTGAGDCYDGVLPAHLEGMTPPADGSPALLMMSFDDEAFSTTPNATTDYYKMWKISVDWTTPSNSTLTGPVNIPAPEMDVNLCSFNPCVSQKNSTEKLDSLSFFTMNRLVYRKFADHDALWINNSVNLGSDRSGIRWAEIRDPNGTPSLFQSGTLGPDDGLSRWMGSLSVDRMGNMALGYSVSSANLFPSIRYSGRLALDPPGTLAQTETELQAGTGSQTASFSRWGDYSAMSIDNSDGCTFWYTNEFYTLTGSFDFHTAVGSFRFPNCTDQPTGIVTGRVTDSLNGTPLVGASVAVGGFSTITNLTGNYSINVPTGTYDVTATAVGYQAQTVPGVVVGDGATVTQDFALVRLVPVTLSGTVTDGSGAGWPLYAKVVITPSVGPTQTLLTNPASGLYSATVFANSSYSVSVTPQINGYLSTSRTVNVGPTDQTENFTLAVDAGACNAPGYGFVTSAPLASESFDAGIPGAWTVTNSGTKCDSGTGIWDTTNPEHLGNLTGGGLLDAEVNSDACGTGAIVSSDLVSPTLDLSGVTGTQAVKISFHSDYRDFCQPISGDAVTLDVWNGSSWVSVFNFCGADRRGPRQEAFVTNAANGVASAKVRFHYVSGWDWWWQVDDVTVSPTSCQFGGGGIVLGNVYDANTSAPLNDASLVVDGAAASLVKSAPTPTDPTLDDGFYLTYVPAGNHTLSGSKKNYATENRPITVTGGTTQRQDFRLKAGIVAATPVELRKRLLMNTVGKSTLTLKNTGTAPSQVKLLELDAPRSATSQPTAPAGTKLSFPPATKEEYLASVATTSIALGSSRPPVEIAHLPVTKKAGDLTTSFATGLAAPWGIGFNVDANDLWVGNIKAANAAADDKDHRFTAAGASTADTIDTSTLGGTGTVFAADIAYNTRTGMLWQVAVGGDNCLHELDPVAKVATGNTICGFSTSMRGVAYNPITDTYYVGTWNNNFVVEVNGAGTILRTKTVGIRISGLAFNPRTGHLFAQVNDNVSLIYVMDVNANFNIVSAFPLMGPTGPAYASLEGAGLEMDCAGNLWSVNQVSKMVFVNRSGETNTCVSNIPWLTETPQSTAVPVGGSVNVTANFTAVGIPAACYEAQLLDTNDTPYGTPVTTVGLTVQFHDVPPTTPSDKFIHALAGADITHGCATGFFCPNTVLNRANLAVWVLRSKLGTSYAPPPAKGIFDDVAPESFGADYMEDLFNRGIINKCNLAGPMRLCPNGAVLKREMAQVLLKTQFGATYTPPACTGVFKDVPCTDPNARWIEDAFKKGYMAACIDRPTVKFFCPIQAMTRAQSAEADAKTFGIAACKQ